MCEELGAKYCIANETGSTLTPNPNDFRFLSTTPDPQQAPGNDMTYG